MGMNAVSTVPLTAFAVTQLAVVATSIDLHRTFRPRWLRRHPPVSIGFGQSCG